MNGTFLSSFISCFLQPMIAAPQRGLTYLVWCFHLSEMIRPTPTDHNIVDHGLFSSLWNDSPIASQTPSHSESYHLDFILHRMKNAIFVHLLCNYNSKMNQK